MRSVLTTLSLLALGIWLGALLLFVQVAAVAFGALPPLFARLRPTWTFARVKQLAHNKNEVTVMVRNAAPASKMI